MEFKDMCLILKTVKLWLLTLKSPELANLDELNLFNKITEKV